MGSRNGGIRNLSMKKFGTPIGAGPGRAAEKVGLAGVGTPSPWRMMVPWGASAMVFAAFSAASLASLRSALPVVFWPCWPPAEMDGAWAPELIVGACWASVLVLAGAASGAGEVLVPVSAGAAGASPVPVAAGGVEPVSAGAGAGASCVTLSTGVETPGSGIWSAGVSAGASTWTVTVWPPTSVTVMVRSWAEAGKTAAPKPAVNAPAETSPMRSLRRLMKGGIPLPRPGQDRPRRRGGVTLARQDIGEGGTLLACFWLCKPEPSVSWPRSSGHLRRVTGRRIGRWYGGLEVQTCRIDGSFPGDIRHVTT